MSVLMELVTYMTMVVMLMQAVFYCLGIVALFKYLSQE